MTVSYERAYETLKEGDSVRFCCDKFGKPLFRGSDISVWNSGVITKILGRNNPLYFLSANLHTGEAVNIALNGKNWPIGMRKVIKEIINL